MSDECFLTILKKAFATGIGYALSVVFTSKMVELSGLFESQRRPYTTTFGHSGSGINTNTNTNANVGTDTNDCESETEFDMEMEDPEKFKNLLKKL